MTGADPRRAGIDPAHVLAICEHVAISAGHKPVGYVTATDDGVSVRLASVRAARNIDAALTRAGYQTELQRPGRRWKLLVTGWNDAALESRLAATRATIHQLRAQPTASASAAISHYQHLSERLPATDASATALRDTEHELRATVAARCGIAAPRDPAILPADTANALRLRAIWALEQAISELIERHLRVARRALALFCSLRRDGSDDWAKDAAIRRATAASPGSGAIAADAASSPAPPSLWQRDRATGTAPSAARGQQSADHTAPGQQARLDFPSPAAGPIATPAGRRAPVEGDSPAYAVKAGERIDRRSPRR